VRGFDLLPVDVMSSPAVPTEHRADVQRAVGLSAVNVGLPRRPHNYVSLNVPDGLDGRRDQDLVSRDNRCPGVDVHRHVLPSRDKSQCRPSNPSTGNFAPQGRLSRRTTPRPFWSSSAGLCLGLATGAHPNVAEDLTSRAEREAGAGSTVVADWGAADTWLRMPKSKLDIAREALDAYRRRDVRAMCDLSCDDAELYTLTEGVTEVEPFRGHAGIARWIDTELEPWDDFRIQPTEFREVGDGVLVRARVTARGHGSMIELEADCGLVFDFREGRIARVRSFLQWEEALEAAVSREYK
jgi:ketosteroid isomerase-like protein